MYYRKCKVCGANLDPGERCDCEGKQQAKIVSAYRDGKIKKQTTYKRA